MRFWLYSLGFLSGSLLLLSEPVAQPRPTSAQPAGPPQIDPKDDRIQRRAIRGGPLDLSRESAELRELRLFEEESFPRATQNPPNSSGSGLSPSRSSTAPANAGPDALPEGLHSPLNSPKDSPRHGDETAIERPTIPWLQALKLLDNLGLSPTFVRFEGHVIRYLEFFKEEKRGRSIMASWLRKQGRYRSLIEQTLERHSLPRFLLYVAMIESGYDPHDRSHKGAVGLWQFMPEGARIYGLRVDYWIDERKDPVRSTEAAARYLGDLKARFGSWHLALAAFNAGYGAVLRSMQKYNTNDYWELCRHEDGLPWETLNYVPKAIASALVGENRSFFGYEDLPTEPALQFEPVQVSASLSFEKIARVVSSTPEELARLNPELRRGRTPPMAAGESWTLRLPPGTAATFMAQEAGLRRAEPLVPYVVRFGERIEDIARERGTYASTLRHVNGIEERDSSEVRAGLTLLVPPVSEKNRGGVEAPAPSEEMVVVAVPDKDLVVPHKKRVFYRVIPGDSIWAIAHFFKVKEGDLARWNNLDLEATLATKMVLDIWVDSDFDLSQAVLVDPARVRVVTTGSDEFFEIVETLHGRKRIFHTVKAGETFEHLGKRYGLTVQDIERINRMGRQTDLVPGQKITIYQPMTAAERTAALAKLRGLVAAEPEGPPKDSVAEPEPPTAAEAPPASTPAEGPPAPPAVEGPLAPSESATGTSGPAPPPPSSLPLPPPPEVDPSSSP